jgi:hypothetical protein
MVLPPSGARVNIVAADNVGRQGIFLSRRGVRGIYGWVLLDGEQERQFFHERSIERIMVVQEEPPPPVAHPIVPV